MRKGILPEFYASIVFHFIQFDKRCPAAAPTSEPLYNLKSPALAARFFAQFPIKQKKQAPFGTCFFYSSTERVNRDLCE